MLVALAQLQTVTVITAFELRGIDLQNTEEKSGEINVSMAGGAPIMVKGSGLSDESLTNKVLLSPSWIQGAELVGPPLTENDQFNSAPAAGKLAFTAPSVMDLMGEPIESFNNEVLPNGIWTHLDFDIKIDNSDETLECGVAQNCKLRYNRYATPFLVDTIPSNVYQD